MLDELAIADPVDLTKGLNWVVSRQAEEIVEMCRRWGMKPRGVADDECFSAHGHDAGSIAAAFAAAGVHFDRAHKGGRVSGWARLKQLLADASEVGKAGMYISRSCHYFWATLPYIGRDARNREDCDSRSKLDHGADAARYSCCRVKHSAGNAPVPWR